MSSDVWSVPDPENEPAMISEDMEGEPWIYPVNDITSVVIVWSIKEKNCSLLIVRTPNGGRSLWTVYEGEQSPSAVDLRVWVFCLRCCVWLAVAVQLLAL